MILKERLVSFFNYDFNLVVYLGYPNIIFACLKFFFSRLAATLELTKMSSVDFIRLGPYLQMFDFLYTHLMRCLSSDCLVEH
jgi:hypothetical protein